MYVDHANAIYAASNDMTAPIADKRRQLRLFAALTRTQVRTLIVLPLSATVNAKRRISEWENVGAYLLHPTDYIRRTESFNH